MKNEKWKIKNSNSQISNLSFEEFVSSFEYPIYDK